MSPADDEAALIELAYAAVFVTLVDKSGKEWDKPVGEIVPGDLERECYRLTTRLGLSPLTDFDDLEALQEHWRKQLRKERQRQIFDLGNLLVRQHAAISYLQCHPDSPDRPEMCFVLDEMRRSLASLFHRFKLKESLEALPVLPLPGAPDSWANWSGDALRDCVLKELAGPPEPVTPSARADTGS